MNRDKLLPLVHDHTVDVATIDDKVRHILRTIIAAGFLDTPQRRDDIPLDDPASDAVALEEARRGIVLLKNDKGLLPLDRSKIKRIAVIGPNVTPAVVGGAGSAFVTPFHAESLLDGLTRAGGGIEVDYHPGVRQATEAGVLGRPCFDAGLRQEVFAGRDLAGSPVATIAVDRINFLPPEGSSPAPEVGSENYSIRWTGTVTIAKPGKYRILTNADDGIRVFVDQSKVLDDWHDHAQTLNRAVVGLRAGPHTVVVEYYQGTGGAAAQFGFAPDLQQSELEGAAEVQDVARRADVVIVAVGYGQSADTNSVHTAFRAFWPPPWARKGGLVEAEDSDRPFQLPAAQVETLRLAIAANPHTVVVVNAGGGVDLRPFVDRAGALLWAWYPGQEGGRAVAEILFGDVNPSGKLPVTFAKRYADYPSAASYNLDLENKTPYKEGIFVGYRGFEASRIEPAFPFGFGLSYTSFEYSDLQATPRTDGSATVTLKVTNRGKRSGEEVVEVYVAPPRGPVLRPAKELKGFARVSLSPGETKDVAIELEPSAFAYWDQTSKTWVVAAGTYDVLAGASSIDIRSRRSIDVASRALPP